MNSSRDMHPDFIYYLKYKDDELIDLFTGLRAYVLSFYPDCNEILYHTHALTAVFSISEKISDAFCTIPIYTKHFNLAFNKGVLLNDPHHLLTGTGKLMRHIAIQKQSDYKNLQTEKLITSAIDFAINDMDKPSKVIGQSISKIKIKP